MLKANDAQGKSVSAKNASRDGRYYCPYCGEEVLLRRGDVYVAHFAHKTQCPYVEDKDYMTEWHLRMQDYFPEESKEYWLENADKSEKRRADVFIEESNTVIEFQHSPISLEEYTNRTLFHLNEGRRIVWIFDESKENPKQGDMGKLRKDGLPLLDYPHNILAYKWLNRRRCLTNESDLPRINIHQNSPDYAVCLYTGAYDTDCVNRIVHVDDIFDFEYITISIKKLEMHQGMDVDDFFRDEEYWIPQSPIAEKIKKYRVGKALLAIQLDEENKAAERIKEARAAQREAEKRAKERKALDKLMGNKKSRNWWL